MLLVTREVIARLKLLLLQQVCHEESREHSFRQAAKLPALARIFFRLWFCSGVRRACLILSISTTVGSHNLLWGGSGRHLGSGNVLAVSCFQNNLCLYLHFCTNLAVWSVQKGRLFLSKGSYSFRR